MSSCFKKLFFLSSMLFSCSVTIAQLRIEHASHTQGTLQKEQQTLKFIDSFKVLPETKAVSLANAANKIIEIVCQTSQLNPPVGFDARVNASASDLGLKETEPRLNVLCYLRYLIKNAQTTEIKKSMDGTDLMLNINWFDLFHQAGNYWQACSELKLPLFFEEIPLSDSTNDYIAFEYKGDQMRMVLGNNKPFFIPLTRKEFIQFLIARGSEALKTDQETLQSSQKSKVTITKLMVTESESDKAYSASTLKSIDYAIEQWQKNIQQQEEENDACKSLLNSMTPEEAAAPARMDYNKKSNSKGFGSINQLVPVGRREGVMLTKINPQYYNKSPKAPVAQLITIYYVWPKLGFEQDPDYLQQKTIDIFNQLDYHQLKQSMK
jgi:hypothetical protein